jgi:hypothetical protein
MARTKYAAGQRIVELLESNQCELSNYPKDLNRIEYSLTSSGFHVADYYTINHDADNVIRFNPKTEGVLKLMIQ